MNNRDLIKNTLSHIQCEKIPFNIFFTPSALEKAEKYYGSPLDEVLNFPLRIGGLNSFKPTFAVPTEYGKYTRDEFGVLWSTGFDDRGIPIGPCIIEPDIKKYIFPDPKSPYRYKDIESWLKNKNDSYRLITVGDLWERATFMRGFEDILMDLYLNPKFVYELMQGIMDYNLATMEFLSRNFNIDGIVLSDDYGTQKAMIVSPETWRKFIKIYLFQILKQAKKYGWIIFLHSCGYIEPIIKDLIEMEVDILHPIQPETMDIFKLKRNYGSDITFCGGLSTQRLLPYGKPHEIKESVKMLKEVMGKNGGYILDTGIQIIPDVPIENIVAFIDEVKN